MTKLQAEVLALEQHATFQHQQITEQQSGRRAQDRLTTGTKKDMEEKQQQHSLHPSCLQHVTTVCILSTTHSCERKLHTAHTYSRNPDSLSQGWRQTGGDTIRQMTRVRWSQDYNSTFTSCSRDDTRLRERCTETCRGICSEVSAEAPPRLSIHNQATVL